MKIGHTIDSNGFLTGDILEEGGLTADVTVLCPDGFYKPKWNGTVWMEGLTQAEINAIKNAPISPTVEQRLIDAENWILDKILGGI